MRTGTDALISIRPLQPSDRPALRRILQETGVFTGEEVEVALELIDIFIGNPDQKDYRISTALDERYNVVGYYCIGPTPMTDGTFDLYWIAVDPSLQKQGIGVQLLLAAEEEIRAAGGRLLIAETSSQPKYEKTRNFYGHNKFEQVARIKDYYRTGDDLVIYGKYVSQ